MGHDGLQDFGGVGAGSGSEDIAEYLNGITFVAVIADIMSLWAVYLGLISLVAESAFLGSVFGTVDQGLAADTAVIG